MTGAAAAIATVGGQLLSRATSAVQTARERLGLPAAAKPAPPVPAGAELGLSDLTPYVTANDNFYRIDTALQVPVIDPADWSLTITGMVDNPITLDYATLPAKPLVEHMATLDLRVQRGRRRPRRQRPLAGLPDPGPAGPGRAAGRAPTWSSPPATTAGPPVRRSRC